MIKSMYKKILTITLLTILFFSIICANNFSYALSDVTNSTIWNTWQPTIQDSTSLTNKVEPILGVIRVLGVVISVGTLAFIGIRFMYGSLEEKAKYKEQLIPWIIGATMIFAITTIPSIIYDLTSSATTIPNQVGQNGGTHKDFVEGYDEAVLNIAYGKLENYKYEASYGSNKQIRYDIASFQEYLEEQLEANQILYKVNKNKYYDGICQAINTIIKTKLVDINTFVQYAEGYKEAVYEITHENVTKKNINEKREEEEADRYFYEGKIEEKKYNAKKLRLENQRIIYNKMEE